MLMQFDNGARVSRPKGLQIRYVTMLGQRWFLVSEICHTSNTNSVRYCLDENGQF